MTSSPPSPLRLLPTGAIVVGRELHPLKIGAFPRRTVELRLTLFGSPNLYVSVKLEIVQILLGKGA